MIDRQQDMGESESTRKSLGRGSLDSAEALAEVGEIARVGWWELDFRTNDVFWCDRTKAIHEVPPDFSPDFVSAVEFYAPQERDSLAAVIDRSRRDLKKYSFTGLMTTAKGNRVWLRSIGKPIIEDGECVGIRGVCQDVTSEKSAEIRAREKDDRLKRTMAFAQIGFFEWNLDTDRVYWDRGCCRLNGIDKEEMRLPIDEVRSRVHPDDFPSWEKGLGTLKKIGDIFDLEHRIIGVDGVCRWVYVRAELVSAVDGSRRLVGMVTNITERQEAKEEILRAKDEADRANRAKSEFLALMNHELRTPLSTIIGPCEIVLEIAEDPEMRRFLEMAVESGRHLLDLINRVLDLARLESEHLGRQDQRVAVRPFLQDFLKPLTGSAQRKGVKLLQEFDCRDELIFDPLVVRQVLYNLVGNAIKYCQDCRVLISIKSTHSELILAVEDEGPGISESEKQRIFEQFHRIQTNQISRVEGSGLGLAICRRLAELVGGSLELESPDGNGSKFIFRMPIQPEAESKTPLAEPKLAGKARVPDEIRKSSRILVVEDNESNRVFIEAVARSMGMEFDSFETGEEAVEAFRPGVHRVVLMDIFLPGVNGEVAASQIREKAGDEKVYIIAQTAGVVDRDGKKVHLQGMDDFVPKPIGLSVFTESIRKGLIKAFE